MPDFERVCAPNSLQPPVRFVLRAALLLVAVSSLVGCGKSIQHKATEQLVLSDAVDRSVSRIDFTPLSGAKCYLDDTPLKGVKLTTVVNSGYVVSSLRNQIAAAGCQLVDEKDEAEVVIEARLGTLAADNHEVTYGIPSSNLLSQAASVMTSGPTIPTIPEVALAKKDDQTGASKVAVFAYDAKTGNPIWQSGLSIARSTARNVWVAGIGPFQSGSVYESPQFAGAKMSLPLARQKPAPFEAGQVISLDKAFLFDSVPKMPSEDTATAMVDPKKPDDE